MKYMKKVFAVAMVAAMAFSLVACSSGTESKEEQETVASIVVEEAEETETEEETLELILDTDDVDEELGEGLMRSYLTGEIISTEVGLNRPFAVMINNISAAMPQTGISHAEIIYEALVEGGITRLMAFFQDVEDVEKIGSVRSLRHNYLEFADEFEAIVAHYGQSTYAQDALDDMGITTINGLSGYESIVCYRDTSRVAPHNVFTTGAMLIAGAEYRGLSREYSEDYTTNLKFNTEDTVPDGDITASKVSIPFNSAPYFVYNEEDGLYYRYQYGTEHIDDEDGSQLCFKNIIIQYVAEKSISSDDHQDMTLTGTGKGYYISDGVAVEIIWQRATADDQTTYYDASTGKQIRLNTGKTMFEIVPDTSTVTIE